MRHINVLSSTIGVRVMGSTGERRAAEYVRTQLSRMGYAVTVQEFPTPRGESVNVIAEKKGQQRTWVVLGAHLDTKAGSPGADDNASGVAVLLELARIFARSEPREGIRFIFFGAEEMSDSNPDHHHYGSRYYVRALSQNERKLISEMICVDMVGVGRRLHVRSMKYDAVDRAFLRLARSLKMTCTFRKDRSRYGSSDHEPFEKAGIPSTWIQRRPNANYHSPRDTASTINRYRVASVGKLLRSYLIRRLALAQ
jgi:Zn-dependent M28 family amino/carboxypeptidase